METRNQPMPSTAASSYPESNDWPTNVAALRQLAWEMVAAAALPPGASISRGVNTTGLTLRLPGGSGSYPAFWIRDAAMMLGADLITAQEIEGWIRLIAAVQPGPDGICLHHGLVVPGHSIPDHINVNGRAVWYPGTYSDSDDQGTGQFGFLPPADNAFYFIQMVCEHHRLTGTPDFLRRRVPTGDGAQTVMTVCDRAFASVAVDPASGIVLCSETATATRVDWGFCDSIRKTGLALFPTILRYRAARDLAALHAALGETVAAETHRKIADGLRESVPLTFLDWCSPDAGLLLSATGLGRKHDVWGSAFALTEGILPAESATAVRRGLLALYAAGGIVADGQVRPMPPDGPAGGYWEQAGSPPGHYQNGAFWGTMSGWLIAALHPVDPAAAQQILHDLVTSIAAHRADGAPWEWINPAENLYRNPQYCATVALPYTTLHRGGLTGTEP